MYLELWPVTSMVVSLMWQAFKITRDWQRSYVAIKQLSLAMLFQQSTFNHANDMADPAKLMYSTVTDFVLCRTSKSGILSFKVTPNILRRDRTRDRRWLYYIVSVTLPYNREEIIIVYYYCDNNDVIVEYTQTRTSPKKLISWFL